VQHVHALLVHAAYVCPVVDQKSDHRHVPIETSVVQRRESFFARLSFVNPAL